MKYSFLKVLLSLKKTKLYLSFSNFRGRTSAGGEQALVQKPGQMSDGGIGKIFAGWGDPQYPQVKKPCAVNAQRMVICSVPANAETIWRYSNFALHTRPPTVALLSGQRD